MDNTFLGLIETSIQNHWELPALTDYKGSTFYYKDFAEEIAKLHLLFGQLQIEKGDKIALIGRNSSRWAISFFAVLSYGAVVVPVLQDFNPENVYHITNHSETFVLFTSDQIWENLARESMPTIHTFISLDNFSVIHSDKPNIATFQEHIHNHFLQAFPESLSHKDIKYHQEEPDELAVLNYTSGTTGSSKGVMLPYRSLWSNTQFAASRLTFISAGDNFVSMLPMAHMYGLAFEILNGINKGCHIHFLPRVPNPALILESFSTIRPGLIIAVPLIIEKIIKNTIFPLLEEPKMKFLLKIPLVKQMIQKKICVKLNQAFGNNFFEIIIGGASLNTEVELFLKSIGFRYTVGYGMTECGPLVSYEDWYTFKTGSVGKAVDRMEIRIKSTDPEKIAGEILVKGINNMLGYYKNPTETAQVMLPDGWMRTGDLGIMDKDGFLFIRGRSKAMILSSSGQNIYPEEIENMLNGFPYVNESLIVSRDGKLVALIHPLWDKVEKDGLSETKLQEVMENNLKQLNISMPRYSKIANTIIRKEGFEKTPKHSIKRFLYQNE